jgi:hypothetical protein
LCLGQDGVNALGQRALRGRDAHAMHCQVLAFAS